MRLTPTDALRAAHALLVLASRMLADDNPKPEAIEKHRSAARRIKDAIATAERLERKHA